ncbi:MAG: molybdenum cofactor guanylyltransferase [Calditrichia bacterium]
MIQEISAAILAGGKSTRFGEPKETARFQDYTLLEIALSTARNISDSIMVVGGSHLQRLAEPIKVYPDIIPECGPIGGIYTALFHTRTPYVAVLPCDMPLLNPAVYRLLFVHRSGNRPVVATSEKGLEPLVSIWHQDALPFLTAHILEGHFGLRGLLRELGMIELHVPDMLPDYHPHIFLNINYKKDLKALQIHWKGDWKEGSQIFPGEPFS